MFGPSERTRADHFSKGKLSGSLFQSPITTYFTKGVRQRALSACSIGYLNISKDLASSRDLPASSGDRFGFQKLSPADRSNSGSGA
jgi:hypothetical protein